MTEEKKKCELECFLPMRHPNSAELEHSEDKDNGIEAASSANGGMLLVDGRTAREGIGNGTTS